PKVAFNPQDRFVVTMGNRIIVTTNDGGVFAHTIDGNKIGPLAKLEGPKVAFNPQDRFVVTMGNRIIVTTNDGGVFAHDIDGNVVRGHFQMNSFTDTLVFRERLGSDLSLGGSAEMTVRQNGNYTIKTHAHNSGFNNIDYSIVSVLVASSGIAFTAKHAGSTEGLVAGLPFGTPDRDDDAVISGNSPILSTEWENILNGPLWDADLTGKDATVEGLLNAIVTGVKSVNPLT
ncbi:hypothetical protein, partial [Streptomyces flaveolus]